MLITSLENERVKNYIKLMTKKYRDNTNTFIVEGTHLVNEAYKKGIIKELILLENEEVDFPFDNIIYVTKEVMNKISNLDTPVNVLALCEKIEENSDIGNKILMLDEIQDPGNLGTIIRSAKAFNIDTIILGDNTVDLYNPKVVRATQGAMFYINIIKRNLIEEINTLKSNGVLIYVTDVVDGYDVRDLTNEEKDKFAIVMGNEGNGVSEEVKLLSDKNLYIELNNDVESLNVSIATSIMLYELNRRN